MKKSQFNKLKPGYYKIILDCDGLKTIHNINLFIDRKHKRWVDFLSTAPTIASNVFIKSICFATRNLNKHPKKILKF